jgi:hypothetical protein
VDEPAAETSKLRPGYYKTLGSGGYLHPWGAAERIARDIDPTNPDDLTYAEVECRRLVRAEVDQLRGKAPGFEQAYLAGFAATLGITESRRLIGRHIVSRDEIDVPCSDAVAITGHWTKYGSTYEIPWDSLLPQSTTNLGVAGRCISVDHRTHHATKEIPACFATGEAAGLGATMALQRGIPLAELDVQALRQSLRAAGAYLG